MQGDSRGMTFYFKGGQYEFQTLCHTIYFIVLNFLSFSLYKPSSENNGFLTYFVHNLSFFFIIGYSLSLLTTYSRSVDLMTFS